MSGLVEWLLEHEPSFRKSRLPSLYSDLSVQKNTNPEGYAANITIWQSALVAAALAGKLSSDQRLTLSSSEDLLNALASPEYGRPSGLGLVFDEAVLSGKMLDLKDFTNSENSIYQRSWLPGPMNILKWSLRQAGLINSGSYDVSGRLRHGQLVLVAALEQMCSKAMESQAKSTQSIVDRIMTRETFKQRLAQSYDINLTIQDLDVLLRYMSRDKQLLSYDRDVIKFKASSSEKPDPIVPEDSNIASLKSLMSSLEQQVSKLADKVTELQTKAKVALNNSNKTLALSALKSKKLAENSLQQRTATLHQLEEVFSKIEEAVDQVQLVEVMQASTEVLKGLNKRVGGVERVDNVIEDLREQMEKVDEVGQVIQEPLNGASVIDEAEIDDEFEMMQKEAQEAREREEARSVEKRLEQLPKVGEKISTQQDQEQDLQASMDKLEKLQIEDKQEEEARVSSKVLEQSS